jgi:hypothetical protein
MVHIRTRLGALACAALFCAATGAAHAATFDLSYTFASGDTLTGSVQGTRDGAFIEGLSDIHLAYDGDVFAGTLSAAAWDPVNSQVDATSAARLSTNASLNNFIVTGSTGDYEFLFVNGDANVGSAVLAADARLSADNAAFEAPVQGRWIVTAAAVPEPGSLALVLAGLGAVGVAARRRRVA